jgi:broad specificity phosphatase PhoE
VCTTILIIRHGETAWNREGIFRGLQDVPLNDTGRAQAALTAEALAERNIDAAYTSPLSRAAETAAIVLAPHRLEALVHGRLKDFDYGLWTGNSEEEVARRWPEEHALWLARPHAARPPQGDTLAEVSARAMAAVSEAVAAQPGGTLAVFAHRVVNKLLVLGMLGLPLSRFGFIRQDNACIDEFQHTDGGCVVVTLNDTSHIRGRAHLLNADF